MKGASSMQDSRINLSIIVPAYNASKSLQTCLESIAREASSGVETIVVNDGSQDDTARIVSSFSQLHPTFRLHYVYEDNSGVAVARNTGLRHARGRFVTFVDADDVLEYGWYKTVSSFFKSSWDVVSFRIVYMKGNNRAVDYLVPTGKLTAREMLRIYCSSYSLNSACARLFSSEYVRHFSIHFMSGVKMGEDALFMGEFIKRCASFYQTDDPIYRYEENPDSATHVRADRMTDTSRLIAQKYALSSQLDSNSQRKVNTFLIHSFFSALGTSVSSQCLSLSSFESYINRYWGKAEMNCICSYSVTAIPLRNRLQVWFVRNRHYRLLLFELGLETLVKRFRLHNR